MLVLDIDGDGRGWFMDASATAAVPSAAAAHYDLLTVATHEVGHLLGFTDDFGGFVGRASSPPATARRSSSRAA